MAVLQVVIGKYPGDAGDYLLLLSRYYNRVADDAAGLTFVRQRARVTQAPLDAPSGRGPKAQASIKPQQSMQRSRPWLN